MKDSPPKTVLEEVMNEFQHFNQEGQRIEARCDVCHLTHNIKSIWPFGTGVWVCEPCIEKSNGFYRRRQN